MDMYKELKDNLEKAMFGHIEEIKDEDGRFLSGIWKHTSGRILEIERDQSSGHIKIKFNGCNAINMLYNMYPD